MFSLFFYVSHKLGIWINSLQKTYAKVISNATMHELEGGEDEDVADEGSEDDVERTD